MRNETTQDLLHAQITLNLIIEQGTRKHFNIPSIQAMQAKTLLKEVLNELESRLEISFSKQEITKILERKAG